MKLSLIYGALAFVLSISVSQGQEKAGTPLIKTISKIFKSNREAHVAAQEPVPWPQNSVSSNANAITPTGKKLRPFGDPNYWGDYHSTTPDAGPLQDDLATLPPLPDLRTPDQITKAEKRRMSLNKKYAARNAKNEATRKARIEARYKKED